MGGANVSTRHTVKYGKFHKSLIATIKSCTEKHSGICCASKYSRPRALIFTMRQSSTWASLIIIDDFLGGLRCVAYNKTEKR